MKKYYFTILTFVCFGATQVSGLLKQFDLKNYKQPELNRLQLDFRLSQNSNSTVPADDSYGESDGIKRKSSFNFNGEGSLHGIATVPNTKVYHKPI